ncbi:ABC transporter substrate-binding protein [Rhodovastum atsumiense]|uniref:ABC transporter substrate-binding protein n=1 Tax=Rhodovastum atsumiense TaxID=504468 RepID=A0A5M6J1D1_9PROT|nr:ABC transporter substrate-binding protein [Rhodovastum atsumiense]KAA5613448.1 ABC transporter substrate-binding protein [Rhodovastum atsumiense]CAH2603183.1 ABC transporter substrate-binding protein [Rhodovastum atsumiense]
MPILSRRAALGGAAAGALAGVAGRGHAAETITVADPGGVYSTAWAEAFYRPFEQESGITVRNITRDAEPTSQVKAIVETRSYIWDVVSVSIQSVKLLAERNLLEPLDWNSPDLQQLIPQARQPFWAGTNVYGTVLAARTDHFGKRLPRSWADFYDVKGFPGRRALPKQPIFTLETALLADGVAPDKLYPLDVDRAFRKLDQVKDHIDVWWASYPQTTQLLQSGEVDLLFTSNARAQAAVDTGAPVQLIWQQGFYGLEGWAIPRGTPRADAARRFIQYSARAKQQALYTKTLSYGPTNPGAYDFIPAKRAEDLPTAPSHFSGLILVNDDWWGANKDRVFDRYTTWLLK